MNFFKQHKQALVVLASIAFLLYANTLGHEFVLDDKIVITENQFTKKGLEGVGELFSNDSMTGFFGKDKNLVAGGRYRPLSMAMHALEWELFGNDPKFYHFTNVLLYLFTGLILFALLLHFFPSKSNNIFGIAFIASAIYLAHPLHTEVVANIKSRDEILSVLLAFGAFLFVLKWLDRKRLVFLLLSGALFFLSLLSKESSVVFVGIVPLAIYCLLPKRNLKEILISTVPLLLTTLIYLGIRYAVLGSAKTEIANELMNNPFLNASTGEKYATIFLTLLNYLKLSVFPHPLTHDYYPKHIPIVDWADVLVWCSVLIHIALIIIGLLGLKKRNIWGFVIFTYLGGLILYSNLLFPIGTFMNERFLYIPTLSVAVAVAYGLSKVKNIKLGMGLAAVLLVLYSFKTVDRNFAWESDETLALTDVQISSESAKCNMAAGLAKIDLAKEERVESKKKKQLVEGLKYLKKSLEIYPTYFPPMILSGNAYSMLGDYKTALSFYRNCLAMSPGHGHALQNLEYVAQEATVVEQYETAKQALELYLEHNEKNAGINEKLGELYGRNLQRPDLGLPYLLRAHELNPQEDGIIQKIGVAYAISGNNEEAINWFEKGIKLDKENARLYLNLGVAYQYVGNNELAQKYMNKAFELEPKLRNGQP